MKRLVQLASCTALSLAMVATTAYAGTNPKGKPFVAINDQIVEVQGAVSDFQDQIDSLVARVDTVEQRVTADEQAIATLNGQNAALQALIDSNLTSIDDINAEILLLQNDSDNLNVQLSALSTTDTTQIDALQAQIAANASLVGTLQSSLLMVQQGAINLEINLQGQIDNNFSLISAIQGEVATLNANIALKQDLINGTCPDGMAVQQINTDGSLVCGEAGGGMSGQLESVYVYTLISVENGSSPTPPGGKMTVRTDCPAGYTIASAGFNAASGWDLNAFYTVSNPTQQYSIAQGFNRNSYAARIIGVATCMRIAP